MTIPLYLQPQFVPQTWEQLRGPMWLPHLAKKWIAFDKLPRYLSVYGDSGSGKTTFTKLLIRSTLCLNRQPGQSDPCGHCAVCKTDPSMMSELSNVHWVSPAPITGESEYKAAQHAVESVFEAPFGYGSDGHLFLVFEEAQQLRNDTLTKLLQFGDVDCIGNHLTIILLSMSPDRIESDIRQAFRGRGQEIQLPKPSTRQLKEYLQENFPHMPEESCDLISKYTQNYRDALSRVEVAQHLDKKLRPEMVAISIQQIPRQRRLEIWEKLANKFTKRADLRTLIEDTAEQVDARALLNQMLQDAEEACDTFDNDLFLNQLFIQVSQNWAFMKPYNLLVQLVDHPIAQLTVDYLADLCNQ